jgi:hypothetical protein
MVTYYKTGSDLFGNKTSVYNQLQNIPTEWLLYLPPSAVFCHFARTVELVYNVLKGNEHFVSF